MSVFPVHQVALPGQHGGVQAPVEQAGAPGQRLADPARTMHLVVDLIGEYQSLESNFISVSEHSKRLIVHTQTERTRLKGGIDRLQAALDERTRDVAALKGHAAALEARAQAAARDLGVAAHVNAELVLFCERLIDAVQPLLTAENRPYLDKAVLTAVLSSIARGDYYPDGHAESG